MPPYTLPDQLSRLHRRNRYQYDAGDPEIDQTDDLGDEEGYEAGYDAEPDADDYDYGPPMVLPQSSSYADETLPSEREYMEAAGGGPPAYESPSIGRRILGGVVGGLTRNAELGGSVTDAKNIRARQEYADRMRSLREKLGVEQAQAGRRIAGRRIGAQEIQAGAAQTRADAELERARRTGQMTPYQQESLRLREEDQRRRGEITPYQQEDLKLKREALGRRGEMTPYQEKSLELRERQLGAGGMTPYQQASIDLRQQAVDRTAAKPESDRVEEYRRFLAGERVRASNAKKQVEVEHNRTIREIERQIGMDAGAKTSGFLGMGGGDPTEEAQEYARRMEEARQRRDEQLADVDNGLRDNEEWAKAFYGQSFAPAAEPAAVPAAPATAAPSQGPPQTLPQPSSPPRRTPTSDPLGIR